MTSDCTTDPDQPRGCPTWSCIVESDEFGPVIRCRTPTPEGTSPQSDYECPENGGGLLCPGRVAGGSGLWQCALDDAWLVCARASALSPPTTGPGHQTFATAPDAGEGGSP